MHIEECAYVSARKVVIIGAGFVGASIAYALTIRNLARQIVLVDIDTGKARAEALDIQHGIPYMGTSAVRAGTYADCGDADLIIITAGRNRRSGETRLDLTQDNVVTMHSVVDAIRRYYTRGVIMVVSNPVDVLTYCCEKWLDLPNGRVFGTGCVLDTSRLVREISNYTGIGTEAVKVSIVGEHGDSQFPVWSRLAIAGVPMEEYCESVGLPWSEDKKRDLHRVVREMGAEIIGGKGRTHYGIATCVCSLADAVLNQRLTIASVTSTLMGEYGIRDVALSVPSIIGVNGVEQRLVERLTQYEYGQLCNSAERLRDALESL